MLGSGSRPSLLRAWLYLVWLSWVRQLRAREMVWIALGLLGVSVGLSALYTYQGRWDMNHWVFPRANQRPGLPIDTTRNSPTNQTQGSEENGDSIRSMIRSTVPPPPLNYREWTVVAEVLPGAVQASLMGNWAEPLAAGCCRAVLAQSGFIVFSRFMIFSIFLSFLLPLFSLAFATEGLGGERENGSLIWLLSRPIPRWAIYLARYVAVLPWSLGLNLGGFALLCLVAGEPGRMALRSYWPAVAAGAFAFTSLFFLLGACFRRPAVLALVYSFFLEILLGNMPGLMKRVSVGFYTRCMMLEAAETDLGVRFEVSAVYQPVGSQAAFAVLLALAIGLVAVGMVLFSRLEYGTGQGDRA